MIVTGNKGFTLVELVAFIVIGGIFLPASMIAFTSVMSNFSTPDYQVKARFMAEQKVEGLTASSYDGLNTVNKPYESVPGYAGYQWKWIVCNTGSSEISLQCSASHTVTTDFSYYKRIEVTVQMPDNSIYDVYTVVSKRPKS